MEEYSEKAKKEFLKSKSIKIVIPDLNPKEVVVFAGLIAANASLGDFSIKLGLSFSDIELHKQRTGILDVDQARAFLRSLEQVDEMASLKAEAERKRNADPSIVKFDHKEEHIATDVPYDANKMQAKLDDIQEVTVEKKTDFTILPKEERKFEEDASKFGINFLIDKWGVEREDIICELKRLNISLENMKR